MIALYHVLLEYTSQWSLGWENCSKWRLCRYASDAEGSWSKDHAPLPAIRHLLWT